MPPLATPLLGLEEGSVGVFYKLRDIGKGQVLEKLGDVTDY